MDLSDDMQAQAKALADPSRFRLFRHIVEADGPVGVAELTELLGFNHNAIRQHLLVLKDEGLIIEMTEERKVRGRPRKQYMVRDDALNAFGSVSGSYEQLAGLLLDIITTGDSAYEVGRRASSGPRGPSEGPLDRLAALDHLQRELAVSGFEPELRNGSTIILKNCPFADVATVRPGVVCELHRGLIDGVVSGDNPDLTGSLKSKDPHAAGCEVMVQHGSDRPPDGD